MAPRPSSIGVPSSPVINSYWSNRCGGAACRAYSSLKATCSRQVAQNVSMSSRELNCETHCAQTDCAVAPEATAGAPSPAREARALPGTFVFTRLALKSCKGNGVHHPLHEVTKPCGQSHGEQFRDTAAGADAHAFLPSLSEDRCVPMHHRRKESRCLPQEKSLVVQKARVFPRPAVRISKYEARNRRVSLPIANRINAPLLNPTYLRCRRALPPFCDRTTQIDIGCHAGSLEIGPNHSRGNVSPTQAGNIGICPGADPRACRLWFVKNKQRNSESDPAHQEKRNRVGGQNCKLEAN